MSGGILRFDAECNLQVLMSLVPLLFEYRKGAKVAISRVIVGSCLKNAIEMLRSFIIHTFMQQDRPQQVLRLCMVWGDGQSGLKFFDRLLKLTQFEIADSQIKMRDHVEGSSLRTNLNSLAALAS
jgi:hypothetical protein